MAASMIRSASVSLFRDSSVSSIAAGFVTVLVGFASTAAIVFQAAQALDATPAQTASWMWALGIGMGATCIALSLRWKMPVVTAWSTPGAAVLATSAAGVSMGEAVAGFLVSALLIAAVLYGIVPGIVKVGGWFELLFVNGLGMPFNSGLIVYIILLMLILGL